MVFVSFTLHLAVVLIFVFGLLPQGRRELRPVYYIDLASMPVADPQAGRPDARPEPGPKAPAPAAVPRPEPPKPASKPEPKVEPKPVPKQEVKPPPTPAKPAPVTKPEPKAEAKPVPKAEAKPAPKTETKPAESYQDTLSAIDKLRRDKEMAELKEKLAALAGTDGRGTDAPLGTATGSGSQAGIGYQEWIREYLYQSWSLSPHQVKRRDLWARTRLVFDAKGALLDYKIFRPSGDETFDESVRRAILKAKQLPFEPQRRLEIEVEFNLKDLE